VGCGGPHQSPQADATSNLASDGDLWPSGVVPVCYDDSDGKNPSLLSQARQILNTIGWSAVANVNFTGWGSCSSMSVPSVQVHFAHGSNGLTSHLGYPGYALGIIPLTTDVTLVDDDSSGNHFQYEVLHEFGHALSWIHEQQRTDNWTSSDTEIYCSQNQAGQGVDTSSLVRTPYFDKQSIMSYCSGWAQELSPGDVAGVQATYGIKNQVANGQSSSNNAAARTDKNLDVFFAHKDGSIWTSYWVDGDAKKDWGTFQLPGSGAGSAPDGAPIAAVARTANNLDIFYAGSSGQIVTSYWSSSNNMWGTFTVPGTDGLAESGEQVAAVAATPGAIDVFFAGHDENLYWSHWSGQCGNNFASQCGWNKPVKVISDGSVPRGAAVAAVARTPDRLDAFFIGKDGQPHTTFCYGFGTSGSSSCTSSGFGGLTISVDACAAPNGGGIAAAARTSDLIEVFYISSEDGLCRSHWSSESGWKSGRIQNNASIAGNPISAVARSFENVDVFFMTSSSSGSGLSGAWLESDGSWSSGGVSGTVGSAVSPSAVVGAVARDVLTLDAFVLGFGDLFGGGSPTITWADWQSPYWPYTNAEDNIAFKSYEADSY
jgi:hypothetical protein